MKEVDALSDKKWSGRPKTDESVIQSKKLFTKSKTMSEREKGCELNVPKFTGFEENHYVYWL